MKLINRYIIFLLIIITILFGIISILLRGDIMKREEGFTQNTEIPKKIWTFWDNDDIPDIVQKCIHTWKKHNPNYEITVVTKKSLSEYLPGVDFSKIKHIENLFTFSARNSNFKSINSFKQFSLYNQLFFCAS
jgi:mannosyltransferase OCH1-like enzyme